MKTKKGNIFNTNCQTIVNTINCVGVMGAGIAYEFRLLFPELFEKYVNYCKENMIKVGTLWIYKIDKAKLNSQIKFEWILNFPTKNHWKYPTKTMYLEKGLQKFLDTYKDKGIKSIAFP